MYEDDSFNTLLIEGTLYKTGDKVTCSIQGDEIKDAIIYITKQSESNCTLCYICQNQFDGDAAPYRFEYEYSWAFYVHPLYGLNNSDVCCLQKLKRPDCFEYILVNAYPRILTYKELINGNRS